VDRRTFLMITLTIGALSVPRATSAQPAGKVYRIGILSIRETSDNSDMVGPEPRRPSTSALVGGLRDLGYKYGEHFVTEPRGGGPPEEFPPLAAELVRLRVDVIVATGPMLPALKAVTRRSPSSWRPLPTPYATGSSRAPPTPAGTLQD
jgi:hypothetical protein